MINVVTYCRVSSEEQTKGLSLEVQEKACRDLCERQGWQVEKVYRELYPANPEFTSEDVVKLTEDWPQRGREG